MARSEVIILSVSQGRGHGAEQALAALLASVPEADRGRISICSPLDSALHGFAMDAGYRWIEWLASRDCFRENARACRHLHRADNLAGYDVIFAWSTRAFEWALRLSRRTGTRCMGRMSDHPRLHLHSAARRMVIRWTANRLSVCVFPSAALADAARECGITTHREVIYNAVQVPEDVPSYPMDHGPLNVGFLGCYAHWKGIQVLRRMIEATRDLPIQWHLFGDVATDVAPDVDAIRRHDSVHVHGHCEAGSVYPSVDITFHPSVAFDPSPNVVPESLAMGRPVIASDVGGTAEMLEPNVNALLFDAQAPDSAREHLNSLLENRDTIREMGARGREFVRERFSPSEAVRRYTQAWDEAGGQRHT